MPCPAGVDIPMCFASYNTSFAINKSTGFHQYMQNTGGMTANQHYASRCTKCGKCEQHCPQSIKIRESLVSVARRMEPFWFKPVMSVARAFMGVKK
jgi:predicted aldo/keto reductase-like oxidoreductase